MSSGYEKSFEQILREYKKSSKEISNVVKQKNYYKKPSEIRREKINQANRKRRKNGSGFEYNDKPFID